MSPALCEVPQATTMMRCAAASRGMCGVSPPRSTSPSTSRTRPRIPFSRTCKGERALAPD